jgi:NTP pyrophosphatase (non-canonical NTP hydrolase)
MNFADFSAINRDRCEAPEGFNHRLDSWSLSDWFTAAMGELGEAANVAKKLNRVRDGIPGNRESREELEAKLRREIADTFVYLDLMAQAAGFDLGEAVADVFDAKSREIGFPMSIADFLSYRDSPEMSPRPDDGITILTVDDGHSRGGLDPEDEFPMAPEQETDA